MHIRVVTWNVENLFRPDAEAPKVRFAVYREKLALIAETLRTLHANIVALQEIGSSEALSDLQKELSGAYPESAISDHPDHRGIRVGFLSRARITSVHQIWRHPESLQPVPGRAIRPTSTTPLPAASPTATPRPTPSPAPNPTAMRRGALHIQVLLGRQQVSIVNAHLKSKLLSYPTRDGHSAFSTTDEELRARVASVALAERTAEAVTLRDAATSLLRNAPEEPFMLLGDLNDVPLAATTGILLGPPGSQPGSPGFDLADSGDGARLFNLANFIPAERRYSRINNGERELIDQILVSQHFVPRRSANRRLRPTVDAHCDFVGKLPSVGVNPHSRENEAVPDHAPVSAQFDSAIFH